MLVGIHSAEDAPKRAVKQDVYPVLVIFHDGRDQILKENKYFLGIL